MGDADAAVRFRQRRSASPHGPDREDTREIEGISCVDSHILSAAGTDCCSDEALLLQSEIAKLKRPNQRVLDAYRQWFKKPYPALGGQAKTFLDSLNDLVALNTSLEADYLSLFLRRHWPAKASAPITEFKGGLLTPHSKSSPGMAFTVWDDSVRSPSLSQSPSLASLWFRSSWLAPSRVSTSSPTMPPNLA